MNPAPRPLLIQKYGGTSVGTPERIQSVAQRIRETHERGHPLVVVVSAMGHSTDELIRLAREVCPETAELPGREMDMLLTAGERISMSLLTMALAARGVPAISLTGSQSGIITDSTHRRARILRILGGRIREGLEQGKVVIVAGFQGVSEQKEITTLGRGGSDTTAVALAASLNAAVCEIYTDVDGVYSADPRHVPGTRLWPEVPAPLMLELAVRGAGVLHPRCVELARQFGVDLRVINSLRDSREASGGTKIMTDKNAEQVGLMEEFKILGVTHDAGKIPVRIGLKRPTAHGSVWDAAGALPMVAPQFQDHQVAFFTDRDAVAEWGKRLSALSVDGFVDSYEFLDDWVPVSVVGTRFSQDSAALGHLIELLAQEEIPVTMGSASALAVTLAVPRRRAEVAVKLLHRKFF